MLSWQCLLIISIHALLTESDRAGPPWSPPPGYFNPRSPHGERRTGSTATISRVQFQSTLSSRRATSRECFLRRPSRNFNPRSPHGERRAACSTATDSTYFNPRSPHGERPAPATTLAASSRFQSTLSSRRATFPDSTRATASQNFNPRSPHGERRAPGIHHYITREISIHALLTESDAQYWGVPQRRRNFNPRSPHGERLGSASNG